MDSCAGLAEARGCPIRIFTDQSLFAAPRNFSQRTTSFIASQCQGIHQMLLSRLMLSLSMSIPCLAISLIPKPLAQFRADVRGSNLGRSEGQTSILRKTYMCSICLSWCGQAAMAHLIPRLSAWPVAGSTSKSLHSRCQSAERQPKQSGETDHTRSQRPNAGSRKNCLDGGARRDRTDDLKLAKLALSQLSYGPVRHPQSRDRTIFSPINPGGPGKI